VERTSWNSSARRSVQRSLSAILRAGGFPPRRGSGRLWIPEPSGGRREPASLCAYLVNYTPLEVPNYKLDETGNIEWIVTVLRSVFKLLRLSGRNRAHHLDLLRSQGIRKYQLDSEPDKPRSMSDVPMIESGHSRVEANRQGAGIIPVTSQRWIVVGQQGRALAARALQ